MAAIGVPVLPRVLGQDAALVVEVAFDGGLGIDQGEWTWTDVSADVRQSPGIALSLGRSDEASTSQPAKCTFVLDNGSGAYSASPEGPYWPNIRQGVPVRVRVDPDGGGLITLFQGYAVSWTPSWDLTGRADVTMRLEAAGILRILGQGAKPVASVMRRVLTDASSVVAYWPCEDGPAATYFAAARGRSHMTFLGEPKPAEDSTFLCSSPLPRFGTAKFVGEVDDYEVDPVENGQQVRALFVFPDSELTDQTTIMRVYTSGTLARVDLRYNVGGAMDLKGYDYRDNLIYDGGAVAFNGSVKGTARRISFEMYQAGGVVHFGVNHVPVYGGSTYNIWSIPGDPNVAGTAGKITRVEINPDADPNSTAVAFGHVVVQNVRTGISDLADGLTAYSMEYGLSTTSGRIYRLCRENGVPLSVAGSGLPLSQATDRLGPQVPATLLELLREVEAADQGFLFDGVSAGLYYRTRQFVEGSSSVLTVDAAQLQLAAPFGPTADDQRIVNVATVTRTRGASATYEQVDGPLGTATVGLFDSSATVNTWRDESAIQYASLMVARGTLPGYRYPSVVVDVAATPELARAAAAARPGSRVLVANVRSVLPGAPDDEVELVVEGVAHAISESGWKTTLACSPFDVWRVGLVADDTGDTREFLARPESDGSTLATSASAGATSISVATPSGPLWTTEIDDFPLQLDVGGVLVTATACSGSSSPQTFTIAPLPVGRPAGVPVTVGRPNRVSL